MQRRCVRVGTGMTEISETEILDELGPVDWIVMEFPGDQFNGTIVPELINLVDQGIVSVLDLLIIKKDAEGLYEEFEIADLEEGELGELRSFETELATLLSEDDVIRVAEALKPGSGAARLVWENKWAAPFGATVRRAGGQLVSSGRIPSQAILAAMEADEAMEGS